MTGRRPGSWGQGGPLDASSVAPDAPAPVPSGAEQVARARRYKAQASTT